MSYTFTRSETFTVSDARYLASKVAADLRQMQRLYGEPSDDDIADYIKEMEVLVLAGCLDWVAYGFKRGSEWVYYLKYSAQSGFLASDDRPGRITYRDRTGANFYSHLSRNSRWWGLSDAARNALHAQIPVERTSAEAPATSNGYSTGDKTYSRKDISLGRDVFQEY